MDSRVMKTYLAIRIKDNKQVVTYLSIDENPPPAYILKYEEIGKPRPVYFNIINPNDIQYIEIKKIEYRKEQLGLLDSYYDFYVDVCIKLEDLEFEFDEIFNLIRRI